MFLSGAVKLASGDPTWRDLSRARLPFRDPAATDRTRVVRHHLPRAVLHFGTVCDVRRRTAVAVPDFRAAQSAPSLRPAGFLLLEFLILVTGNYNFFNLLTIVLCLGLFDDRMFGAASKPQSRKSPSAAWRIVLPAMALLGVLQIHQTLARSGISEWESAVLRVVEPLQLVNSYGLFAVMTTHRDELVVEGSTDGVEWRELPFKFKPQRLDAAPRWATPYQPRLDWQMWFAALTSREGAQWFDNFVVRLLSWCARSLRVARHLAVCGETAAARPCTALPLSVHHAGATGGERGVVASSVRRRLVSAGTTVCRTAVDRNAPVELSPNRACAPTAPAVPRAP